MSKYIVAITLVLAAAVQGKNCEKACKTFEDNNQKYLVHEGKVACKKHNISPRPTTEDICLSTFRALTRSTCLNYCDSNSPLVPEVKTFIFCFLVSKRIVFLLYVIYVMCCLGMWSDCRHYMDPKAQCLQGL